MIVPALGYAIVSFVVTMVCLVFYVGWRERRIRETLGQSARPVESVVAVPMTTAAMPPTEPANESRISRAGAAASRELSPADNKLLAQVRSLTGSRA